MPVKPPAEVDLTVDLVCDLLAAQHPDLAGLPIRLVAQGWDNGMFRLGDDLAVRLPRREMAAALARNEQRWLPVVAALSPVPVPAPVRVGAPTGTYPWSWSVVPWFTGTTVAEQPVAERTAWAADLADALAALHVPGPADAPVNPVRGGALAGRAEALAGRIADGHLDRVLDGTAAIDPGSADGTGRADGDRARPSPGGAGPSPAEVRARARRLFDAALAAPAWPGDSLWLHGDPHPANLLVRDGRLTALLDFGDMTTGDPATDLATAWLTFDPAGRAAFRTRTEARGEATGGPCTRTDPGLWSRAAGWALVMSSAMVTHGDDDPVIAAIGRHAVHALLG